MANDHPLLTYIEDPFAIGDINGYQKIANKFKDSRVQISIKNWFGSDLKELKKHTQLIQENSESEDGSGDEAKNEAADE